jgi:alkylation response protein AidB-like acyl-CoA dehydrogenase
MTEAGVRIVETWDTLGMRGTASHDLVFDGVFVPADKIMGSRPYGVLAGPLLIAAIHFAPVVAAVYLGVARGARTEATRLAGNDAARAVGEMHARLRVARWALFAAVEEIGCDPAADDPTLLAVMTAKRHAVLEAQAVVDTALQVACGRAFFKTSPLERAYRDVRGGPFHPMPPEATLELAGRLALNARDTTQH